MGGATCILHEIASHHTAPVVHHLPNPAELQRGLGLAVSASLDALQQLLQVAEQEGSVEAVPVSPYTPQCRVALNASRDGGKGGIIAGLQLHADIELYTGCGVRCFQKLTPAPIHVLFSFFTRCRCIAARHRAVKVLTSYRSDSLDCHNPRQSHHTSTSLSNRYCISRG